MTSTEINDDLRATSRAFFEAQKHKKKPPPQIPIDPKAKEFFIEQTLPVEKKKETDYERSIRKLHSKPENRVSSSKSQKRSSKGVPQLEQQPKQTIEPLIVQSDGDGLVAQFVAKASISKGQLLGQEPVDTTPSRKEYVYWEPLVWPELVPHLRMRMYEVHKLVHSGSSTKRDLYVRSSDER